MSEPRDEIAEVLAKVAGEHLPGWGRSADREWLFCRCNPNFEIHGWDIDPTKIQLNPWPRYYSHLATAQSKTLATVLAERDRRVAGAALREAAKGLQEYADKRATTALQPWFNEHAGDRAVARVGGLDRAAELVLDMADAVERGE